MWLKVQLGKNGKAGLGLHLDYKSPKFGPREMFSHGELIECSGLNKDQRMAKKQELKEKKKSMKIQSMR